MKCSLSFLFVFITLSVCAFPENISNLIHVDQFGYRPDAEKIAVLSNPITGFNSAESYTPGESLEVRNWFSDEIVYSGSPYAWNSGATHAQSGDQIWWFDFSTVNADGAYYVFDPQNNVGSVRFEISACVYNDALRAAVRAFYYQRCGSAKSAEYAGSPWADDVCHTGNLQDTQCRLYNDLSPATEKDLSGGWHDAGDYNKYVNFCFDPVLDLLDAVEKSPALHADNFDIPESGNGVPDLLDEVKYELDWLLKMQNEDGSVLSIVGKPNYDSSSPPSTDDGQRVYGPASTSATFSAAAMYARGAKLFFEYNMDDYATTLQDAAIDAWNWASTNLGVFFYNSGVIVSGEQELDLYGTFARQLCAGIFLYDLTNDSQYLNFVEDNYDEAHLIQWQYAYPFEHTLQHSLIHFSNLPGVQLGISQEIRDIFIASMADGNSDNLQAYLNGTDAYRAYLSDQNYTWGSNTTKGRQGIMFLSMNDNDWDAENSAEYKNAAEAFVQNFHGVNPNHKVYLTNVNSMGAENSCSTIYHAWFADGSALWDDTSTSQFGPAPGFIPGGPNPSYTLDGCCPNGCGSDEANALCDNSAVSPPLNQPIQKSYRDWNAGWPQNSWTVTEIGIYTQAAYVRLLSAFVDDDCFTVGVEEKTLDVNSMVIYPNPASTQLSVRIQNKSGKIENLKITDASGRIVYSNSNPSFYAGNVFSVDVANLANGYYIVSMDTINGTISSGFMKR
jgi:endoglucanase